jgi:predicted peroxiredoxin
VTDELDFLVLIAHGTAEPAFARHAFHLAAAAAAFGKSVGLYFAVEGTTWLSDAAPQDISSQLEELRELGVVMYACPASLSDHGLVQETDAYRLLGAAAAVRLANRAKTMVSL